MAENLTFEVNLQRLQRYQFEVKFDWEEAPAVVMDEPAPLGERKGANASRLLAAAVGNCLSASLLFCLEKSHVEVRDVQTRVRGSLGRNERGRLRVASLEVEIHLKGLPEERNRLQRCLSLFEDYCVVTGTVRKAIPVTVTVMDEAGNVLHRQEES